MPLILVGGGSRSGKSIFALELARQRGARRAFVATAQAFDDEMRERIAHHRAERDASFATIEEPLDPVNFIGTGLQMSVIDPSNSRCDATRKEFINWSCGFRSSFISE